MIIAKELKGKLKNIGQPALKKCAVAYSGGLDSSLGIELLRRVYKVREIIPITVDVGQGKDEIDLAVKRAGQLKIDPVIIDCKQDFSENWLKKAIGANSDYYGYPVSTSMTRQLIAVTIASKAIELGCDSILEGSTGRGNDQFRMHNVFKMFAPDLALLVPVRDFDLTRSEELKLCEEWGVPVEEVISGGDDKTMWCRSIASGAIALNQELPGNIWMWLVPPEKAPARPETVSLTFEQGIPTAINGRNRPLAEIIFELNIVAGRNGIGRIDIFEDGIMGLKSREIYEAPAARLILTLKADLEAQCLTKDEREFKKSIDSRWASLVYHGEWYHPLKNNLDAFIRQSQKFVNGTIKVKLYKGNIEYVEREKSTSTLFFPEVRSIESNSFDQRWCADAARIRGLPFELLAKRREKVKEVY